VFSRRNKMSQVTLHPTKGVNPHLTICSRCGADSGVILLGVKDYTSTCDSCGMIHIGGTNNGKCQKCRSTSLTRKPIQEHEKIPGIICHACEEKQKECDAEVKAGGIYWKCKDCHSTGALKASSELVMHVRNHFGIKAPAPCGVEFSKDDCPVCGGKPASEVG